MMSVVYESATGQPRSFGSVLADPLPDGLTAKELTEEEAEGLATGSLMFDPSTLTMIALPPTEEEEDALPNNG
jgi:hypothetical protein